MAQTTQVIQADPTSLASALTALNREILIVEKTASAGKFLIVSKSPSTGQIFAVLKGDPDNISSGLSTLIGGGSVINIIAPTFSAAHYVVGYV
jgi:hypothetical protein